MEQELNKLKWDNQVEMFVKLIGWNWFIDGTGGLPKAAEQTNRGEPPGKARLTQIVDIVIWN